MGVIIKTEIRDNMTVKEEVSKNLAFFRKQREITQKELSEK